MMIVMDDLWMTITNGWPQTLLHIMDECLKKTQSEDSSHLCRIWDTVMSWTTNRVIWWPTWFFPHLLLFPIGMWDTRNQSLLVSIYLLLDLCSCRTLQFKRKPICAKWGLKNLAVSDSTVDITSGCFPLLPEGLLSWWDCNIQNCSGSSSSSSKRELNYYGKTCRFGPGDVNNSIIYCIYLLTSQRFAVTALHLLTWQNTRWFPAWGNIGTDSGARYISIDTWSSWILGRA